MGSTIVSDRSGANPLTQQSAFPVSGCKVTLFSSYRHHFICIFDGGGRVPAYEAGTLGRDGVRWLLYLVEGAGVVPLASVHHCAFAFDDHCVVGQAFDGQIEVLCYFPFIIVGIIRIGTV